jgi:hypothetical protein
MQRANTRICLANGRLGGQIEFLNPTGSRSQYGRRDGYTGGRDETFYLKRPFDHRADVRAAVDEGHN